MSKVTQIVKDLKALNTGYGLMSLTWKATPVPKEQAFESMKKVVDLALENNTKAFFNVGEFYGPDRINLTYVKQFFEKYPELRKQVIISCKGGCDYATLTPVGDYEAVKVSVKKSVEAIGGFIDVFEIARFDNTIMKEGDIYPVESFKALAEEVEAGIIGSISLSEVTAEQIRAVAKDYSEILACVEVELSLFSTNILHDGVAKACSDLGLIIFCYSPLGRGLLTGQVKSTKDIPEGDFRLLLKRFQGDSLQQNLVLVEFLESIVNERPESQRVTLPQLALGWIKHWNGQKEFSGAKFIPIPSGSTVAKVTDNFDEQKGKITDAEFQKINDFLKEFETAGDRYEM